MHQRNGTDGRLVLQVEEVLRHLFGDKLTLIVNGLVGAGNNVQSVRTDARYGFIGNTFRIFTEYKQFAVEFFRSHTGRLSNENLLNARLGFSGIATEIGVIDRNNTIS